MPPKHRAKDAKKPDTPTASQSGDLSDRELKELKSNGKGKKPPKPPHRSGKGKASGSGGNAALALAVSVAAVAVAALLTTTSGGASTPPPEVHERPPKPQRKPKEPKQQSQPPPPALDEERCRSLAATGHCAGHQAAHMERHCAAACMAWRGMNQIQRECAGYAEGGECGRNPAYMLTTCARECEAWERGKGLSIDRDSRCVEWSLLGRCTREPEVMAKQCATSCTIQAQPAALPLTRLAPERSTPLSAPSCTSALPHLHPVSLPLPPTPHHLSLFPNKRRPPHSPCPSRHGVRTLPSVGGASGRATRRVSPLPLTPWPGSSIPNPLLASARPTSSSTTLHHHHPPPPSTTTTLHLLHLLLRPLLRRRSDARSSTRTPTAALGLSEATVPRGRASARRGAWRRPWRSVALPRVLSSTWTARRPEERRLLPGPRTALSPPARWLPRAQAAPAHPGAPPSHLGSSPWSP